jgi:Na+-driven multidrug efflux pump
VAVFVQRIFFIVAGGTAAVMLYNYPWRFIALFSLPNKALENSLVPVGSAAYGQNDLDKMWAGYMYCLKYTVGISLVVTAAIILFAEPLISIMTYEQSMSEMFDQLVWTLRVAVLLLPFMTLRGIGVSFLQAMKKVRIPLYFDLIWSPLRLVFYALSAYGLLGVDPFEGIIYIMVIMYSFNGIIMTALALNGFRKLRKSVENFN